MEEHLQYGAWYKLIKDVLGETCAMLVGLLIPTVQEILKLFAEQKAVKHVWIQSLKVNTLHSDYD